MVAWRVVVYHEHRAMVNSSKLPRVVIDAALQANRSRELFDEVGTMHGMKRRIRVNVGMLS
jgi:hypothetical protein